MCVIILVQRCHMHIVFSLSVTFSPLTRGNINASTSVSNSLEHKKTLSLGSPSPLVAWSLSLYCSVCISEWSAKGKAVWVDAHCSSHFALVYFIDLKKKHFLLDDLLFETIIMSTMTLRKLLFTTKL